MRCPQRPGDAPFRGPGAGHHLALARLAGGQPAFEALGTGFTLLALGVPEEATHPFEQAAATLSLPLSVVHDPVDGEAAPYAAGLMLVRPDHFVAWAGSATPVAVAQAAKLLAQASGRPDQA